MNELIMERSPSLIATEINSIKEQTRKMVLFNSIEIGRRLAEAKSMLPHGQWGEWLEKSVDYSQSTANNLMRIFEEYGSNQLALFDNNAKSQALGNLSYTQAVALLGLPRDERDQFIKEHDIDSMSTRELQQAIKEKQELEAKLREIESNWVRDRKIADNAKRIAEEQAEEARKLLDEKQQMESDLRVTDKVLRDTQADVKMLQEALEKEKHQSKAEVERLANLLREAKANGASDEMLAQLQAELKEAKTQVERLTEELKQPIEVTAAPIIERVPEEVERELEELRKKAHEFEARPDQRGNEEILKFKVYFDSLVKGFNDLLKALAEITDHEKREEYKTAVNKLIGKMSERL
ncbi:DUF3102 domain-containing protein [Paradesulfitobacterium aromaticivorans]